MSAEEMQYSFEIKLGTFHTPNKMFTSIDVAGFLNKAQDMLVDASYSNKIESQDKYFESDEKTRVELGSLIKAETVLIGAFETGPTEHSNNTLVPIASDVLYVIKERCTLTYTDCNDDSQTVVAKVLPIRHDEYEMIKNSPFGEPYEELILRLDYGGTAVKKHELLSASGQEIQSYSIRYIKIPDRINIITQANCELHVSLHEEIVDRAVALAIASIPQNNVEQKIEA